MTSKAKKETEVSILKRHIKDLEQQLNTFKVKLSSFEDSVAVAKANSDLHHYRLKSLEGHVKLIWDRIDPDE
jgi:hypothetical protein